MKSFILIVSITLVTITGIILLPDMLPDRKFKVYTDDELRSEALNRGMKPIPKTIEGLLSVVDTKDNPMTSRKIKLGKELFFDPILSKDKTINCASCHLLNNGGDDNKPTAIGFHNRANPSHLNSPTVLNAALQKYQFWNGSAKDVEEQAGGPIQAPFEMNMTPEETIKRLKANSHYVEIFKKVFNIDDAITFQNVKKAIGAYERTLLTRGAYDEFLDGDNNAMNKKAKKGLANFINFGCKGCHTGMSVGGQSLQRFPLRGEATVQDFRLNVRIKPEYEIIDDKFPFENTGGFLGKNNDQIFKVPMLRNITKTAPYFHNGAVKEIEDVVKLMGIHQLGMNLTKIQIDEIVEFLESLEGEVVEYDIEKIKDK